MTKEIVIIGASYGGMGVAHYLLKHVIPTLPEPSSYHVTLVDRGSKWFGRVGAPRAIVSEQELSLDKVFLSYEEGFKQYKPEQFIFQQGVIASWDTAGRNVTITLPDGSQKFIAYFALVVATGASPVTPILGTIGTTGESIDAINAFRKAVPNAKTIVIGGGGPAGIEAAGELGEHLNGKAGWFSARPTTVKTKITVVTGAAQILTILRPSLGKKAEKLLNKRGVDVIYNTRVTSAVPEEGTDPISAITSKTTVTLSDGQVLEADLYIPATGTKPNSSFVPAALVDDNSQLKTNPKTLRVDEAGPRVYAVGDVSNAGRGGILEILTTVPIVATNVQRDLKFAAQQEKAGAEDPLKLPPGKDRTFERKDMESQLVPIGHGGGVGAFFGWKLPSFFVWLIKGRDYMTGMYPKTVNGEQWAKESKWKET
jgi:NADH dehydrogenase FAD-containing subunit